jgi:hypothetical protein
MRIFPIRKVGKAFLNIPSVKKDPSTWEQAGNKTALKPSEIERTKSRRISGLWIQHFLSPFAFYPENMVSDL